jgi:hypothetical protein
MSGIEHLDTVFKSMQGQKTSDLWQENLEGFLNNDLSMIRDKEIPLTLVPGIDCAGHAGQELPCL